MAYVDDDHILEWLQDGRVSLVAPEVGIAFHDYLLSLPWLLTRVDWRTIAHARLDLRLVDEVNVRDQLSALEVAVPAALFLLYAPGEPGVLCPIESAVPNLDHLYWRPPGPRYFCAAEVDGDEPSFSFARFGEYDGRPDARWRT
ncbi:hypothetical protein [Cellulomonas septica]|uniref:Uncharacterized protein n=1 Tax=Cellulomonas septica TaxID=285080 RepID=A0ABX1JZI8_9CELL|nr:hypothetical protein [Cellulomonas septica]NKY39745.1 hypothetical protein [Cellulomonas septica]